eukprot:EG_transcript_15508
MPPGAPAGPLPRRPLWPLLLALAWHVGPAAPGVVPYPANRTRISVVYKSHSGDGALVAAWHLKRYEKQYPIDVFYKDVQSYPMDAKTVFLELEEPNRLAKWIPAGPASPANLNKSRAWASKEWLTLTLCPYTADWVNDVLLRRPARSALWLAPDRSLKPPWNPFRHRKLDCLYAGHAYLHPIQTVLNTVFPKFTYEWLLWKASNRPKWAKVRITPGVINPAKKLGHVGSARVTLVHNSLAMEVGAYQSLIHNAAFTVVFNHTLREQYQQQFRVLPVPQIKARMFEAALGGSLMVVWRDHHNLVEMFFEPEREFVYFSTPEEFEAIVRDVKAHPEKYEPIAKRAQERAEREYGVDQLMERVVMPAVLQVMRRHNMSLAGVNASQRWPVTSQRKW